MKIGTVLLLVVPGCKAEQAAKSEGDAKAKAAEKEPAPPTPTPEPLPETDTAVPPEPPAPPEPVQPAPAGPTAGEGFQLGAKLEAHASEASLEEQAPLSHAGATISVTPDVVAKPDSEGESTLNIQVRVEFEGAAAELGLNHTRAIAGSFCEELVPELRELAKRDDGRWWVDVQLGCRAGEDYMSADNAHTLISVDTKARAAAVLWTGADTVSSAMGVCVSESVHNVEVSGEELIIRKTESTELDKEAAEELPDAAEGCEPKPETTTEVARISLAPGK